ncbi:hydrolase [Escherichia coli]|uniref:Hydrolase n=1 Tax=Escherichia coli TaxID=562 RepID=A0A376KKN6_ECOLX|nr:hydrolase [Escherichia coli]
MTIADTIPHYNLMITDNNIDEFVLIIGESARTDNMSIYGDSRPTTPELQKQKSRLKLFTQAISGHLIPPLRYRWHYLLILCCIMMFAITPIILSTWRIRRGSILGGSVRSPLSDRTERLWPVSPCGPETEFMSEAMMSYCSHTWLKH